MGNNVSVGNAGEYFVAGELERRGFTVAVPMSNVEMFDLLILHRDSKKQFAIQVKTNKSNRKEWVMSKKNENISAPNIFYILVCMNGLDAPEYHIIPSEYVSKSITESHQHWLDTPGRNGVKHNDSSMRKFNDYADDFLNRWDLLK